MTDFERAAARLRQTNEAGKTNPVVDIEQPMGSQKGLDSLHELLRKKLSEPLDVVLPEAAPTSFQLIEQQNPTHADVSVPSPPLSKAHRAYQREEEPEPAFGEPKCAADERAARAIYEPVSRIP